MSRVIGLAHVGIAVRSLDESIPIWVRAFGFRHTDTIEFDSMKLRIAFLPATQKSGLGGNREQLCFITVTRQNRLECLQRFGVAAHHRQHLGDADGGQPVVGIARLQPGI